MQRNANLVDLEMFLMLINVTWLAVVLSAQLRTSFNQLFKIVEVIQLNINSLSCAKA